MSKSILIAPTAFKECSAPSKISMLIYNSLSNLSSDYNLIRIPISDGGDGFLESIRTSLQTSDIKYYSIKDYSGQLIKVPVVISDKKLYIESAEVIGLKLISKEKRDPLKLNSAPLGQLFKMLDAENKKGILNIKKIIIGIGGTATNDLGLGLLSEFGLTLYDSNGKSVECTPSEYKKVRRIKWSKPQLSFDIEAIIDVEIPLLGFNGSSYLFARQKGADDEGVILLEEGFRNILDVIKNQAIYTDFNDLPGAGGGLASGLKIFLDAKVRNSKSYIMDDLNLKKYLSVIDYVVTGEGRFDSQSKYGKATSILIKEFNSIPVFLICGEFKGRTLDLPSNVKIIELLKYFSNKNDSIVHFESGIEKACKDIVNSISAGI